MAIITILFHHVLALITPIGFVMLFALPNKPWNKLSGNIIMLGTRFTLYFPADLLAYTRKTQFYCCKQFPSWIHKFFKCKCKKTYNIPCAYAVAFNSMTIKKTESPQIGHFDSDLFLIGINNHATTSISNDKSHFIGPIQPVTLGIQGFGGTAVHDKGQGTIKWHIEDDDGKVHAFTLHNTLYVPESSLCIFCPQHWAKQANNHYPQ